MRKILLIAHAAALLAAGACDAQTPREALPSPTAGSPSPEETTPEETTPASPTGPAPECTDATTGGPRVRLSQQDLFFDPNCLVVLGGQSLDISNDGDTLHNFTVEGTSVDVDTEPGERTRTEAIGGAVSPGTHRFFCEYHDGQGMEGEITVTEAG
jgi:plastocyanin